MDDSRSSTDSTDIIPISEKIICRVNIFSDWPSYIRRLYIYICVRM
jgi:hypothetical protein